LEALEMEEVEHEVDYNMCNEIISYTIIHERKVQSLLDSPCDTPLYEKQIMIMMSVGGPINVDHEVGPMPS